MNFRGFVFLFLFLPNLAQAGWISPTCRMPFTDHTHWAQVQISNVPSSVANADCASNTAELRQMFPTVIAKLEFVGSDRVSGPMEGSWSTDSPMLSCSGDVRQATWCDPKNFSSTTFTVNSNQKGIQFQMITEGREGHRTRHVSEPESAQFCRTAEGITFFKTATRMIAIDIQDDKCAWFADLDKVNRGQKNWAPTFRFQRVFWAFEDASIPAVATQMPSHPNGQR